MTALHSPPRPAPCIAMSEMLSIDAPGIRVHEVPLVRASEESLIGYGRIVRDFAAEEVLIETWPAPGWRRVEPGTGNRGGVVEGAFVMRRQGDLMIALNHAVNGHYVTGWFADPAIATEAGVRSEYSRVLVREANYHPDGGQVFHPREGAPFVALLAPPGDDVAPEAFVAFYFDGSFGLQIFPHVWHQPMFPLVPSATFDDKQGRVHACVAVDLVAEQASYLSVPLRPC